MLNTQWTLDQEGRLTAFWNSEETGRGRIGHRPITATPTHARPAARPFFPSLTSFRHAVLHAGQMRHHLWKGGAA